MDPRTLEDLTAITRERLDDQAQSKPRWSDAAIARGLSEAQREAAVRGRLLRDDNHPATRLVFANGQNTLALHRAFFEVEYALNADTGEEIEIVDLEALRRKEPGWRMRTGSTPDYLLVEVMPDERLRVRLVPTPDVDVIINVQLAVYREPLDDLAVASDELEIAPRHHEGLVAWACYRCFSDRDPDRYDPQRADAYKAEFTAQYGERPAAGSWLRQHSAVTHTVRARDF